MSQIWDDSHRDSESVRIRKQKRRQQWLARKLELKNKAQTVLLKTKNPNKGSLIVDEENNK